MGFELLLCTSTNLPFLFFLFIHLVFMMYNGFVLILNLTGVKVRNNVL